MAITEVAVPATGTALVWILGLSPIPALLQDRKEKQISTDPIPFALAMTSSCVWSIYGVIVADVWLCAAHIPGAVCWTFSVSTALRFTKDQRMASRIELLLVAGVGATLVLCVVVMTPLLLTDADARINVAGTFGIIMTSLQFLAPLAEAVNAVRTGDGSALSLPLGVAGMLCGTFWGVYGCQKNNVTIWGPNVAVVLLSLCSVLTKLWTQCYSTSNAKTKLHMCQQLLLADSRTAFRMHSPAHRGWLNFHFPASLAEDGHSAGTASPFLLKQDSSIIWANVMASKCEVSLQLDDGRFLKVAPSGALRNVWTPTKHVLVATQDKSPGQEGTFIPVDISKRVDSRTGAHVLESGAHILESEVLLPTFMQECVAFWNPSSSVFIRVNETYEVDCSFECNMVDGKVYIPEGWSWEVFHLHFLDEAHDEDSGFRGIDDEIATTNTVDLVTSEDTGVRRRAPSITVNSITEITTSNNSQ